MCAVQCGAEENGAEWRRPRAMSGRAGSARREECTGVDQGRLPAAFGRFRVHPYRLAGRGSLPSLKMRRFSLGCSALGLATHRVRERSLDMVATMSDPRSERRPRQRRLWRYVALRAMDSR